MTVSSKLRLLVCAHQYPPVGGGFSDRMVGYIKYMSRLDCDIYVMTRGWDSRGFPVDFARFHLLTRVAGVHRVREFDQAPWFKGLERIGIGRTIRRAANFVCCPDASIFWSRRCVSVAYDLIRRHGIHAVLTSSTPYSVHLIGLSLKRRLPYLRWVADFRDPMSTNFDVARLKRSKGWFERLAELEGRIYETADHVVLNTPWNRREIIERFGVSPDRLSCFPNGYDPELLPKPAEVANRGDSRVRLLYVSGLRGEYFEGPFLRALAAFKQMDPANFAKLDIHFVGADRFPDNTVRDLGLEKDIRLCGFVEQKALREHYQAADGFLLMLPPSHRDNPVGWVPQKLYNYLYLRKPIFALVPPGQSADYLREYGVPGTVVVSPDSIPQITTGLTRWVTFVANRDETSASSIVAMNSVSLENLSKPVLAAGLLRLLDRLVHG